MNFVKNAILEMWFCEKLRFWKCECLDENWFLHQCVSILTPSCWAFRRLSLAFRFRIVIFAWNFYNILITSIGSEFISWFLNSMILIVGISVWNPVYSFLLENSLPQPVFESFEMKKYLPEIEIKVNMQRWQAWYCKLKCLEL